MPDPARTLTVPVRLLLNSREASKALSVSEKTLYNLTQPRGPIPCVKLGLPGSRKPAVRYDPRDLLAFIDQQKKAALKIAEV